MRMDERLANAARPALGLGLLLLSACNAGPDYRPPSVSDLKIPDQFQASSTIAAEQDMVDLARWWDSFEDPILTQLIDRAFAGNLDVDAAAARLRQARATLRGTQGQALPTAGASGSVTRSVGADSRTIIDPSTGQTIGSGGDTTVYRGGFDVAWEADLFGGIRRSIQAARATAEAREADLRFTQASIASEVGLNYVQARLAQSRLRIARENLAAQDETFELVGWRRQAGLVSSLDYEQARQLRAQTAASIPTIENDYATAVNRIAVLLGEAPGAVTALIDSPASIPLAPGVDAPIPAQVIERRPDVASAERSLAAESARIGVQTAQLYPALRLSGSFSGSSTSIGNVISDGIGNLVAGITAPIFQGGQIRAAIVGQRAATDAAYDAYRQAVLTALEEVENALKGREVAERREADLAVSYEAANNAARYAQLQYRSGLVDFQSLLDSQRTRLSSQDTAASARAARASATIQLYKALGGGWQTAPIPAPGPYEGGKRPAPAETRP
ncbi:RND efflux system, outer membrane lipoprotein, NodT family [Rhizorhabdus wittichii RW1]|uniref:RND efflux system, outer membrane lipoprotein, NodT family n=2 Tax=Rhizorhabdus wittichii TaxID=160791 RepID=A0A9J9LEY3_RHIWR|nr:RND efflux system, outer membrane lipoprotein, NodT family [Rhizorhabdus wittichii RW1]